MKHLGVPLILGFLFISCSKQIGYNLAFSENSCIKELNKQYRIQERAPSSIYKLEEIVEKDQGPQLRVSVWHNYSWYYQGLKKHTYFKDTRLFAYENTNCPDNSGANADFNNKIKAMKIKK